MTNMLQHSLYRALRNRLFKNTLRNDSALSLTEKSDLMIPNWKLRATHFILVVASLFMFSQNALAQCTACIPGNVNNGNNDPWSNECYYGNNCLEQGNPCQAGDVDVVRIILDDGTGKGLLTCSLGEPVVVYLRATFLNNTNADRYAIRTYTEVYIDGVCAYEINTCSFDLLPANGIDSTFLGIITYNCGQVIQLRNTWVAYETNASQCSNAMGANYRWNCGDYSPANCYQYVELFDLLTPNWYYVCQPVRPSTTELCFVDQTVGGDAPYSYKWYFGDGDSSSLQNPCHTYASKTGLYYVRQVVTDDSGRVNIAYDTLDLANLDCCFEPRVATVTEYSSRGCYDLYYSPTCSTGVYDFDLTELYTPATTRGQGSFWSVISSPGCGIIGETFVAEPGCHILRYFVPAAYPGATGLCAAMADTAILQITEEPQPDFELASSACWDGVAGSLSLPTLYNGTTFGLNATRSYLWTASLVSGAGPVPTFNSTTLQQPNVIAQGPGTFRICLDETLSYAPCVGRQVVSCVTQHCELITISQTNTEVIPTWGPVPGPFCVDQTACVDLDVLVSGNPGGVFTGGIL